MEKNEPLEYRTAMLEMTKKVPERIKIKALGRKKQKIFIQLHNLSGEDYQNKLKEL